MSTTTLLTIDEYDAWAAQQDRSWELLDGTPHMTPFESYVNVHAATRVYDAIRGVLGSHEWFVGLQMALTISVDPPIVRIPDLLVAPLDPRERRPRLDATHVRLVVEILSDSTATTDLHTKRAEYRRAGIPAYLLVDLRETPALRVVTTTDRRDTGDTGWTDRIRLDIGGQTVDLRAGDLLP